MALPPTGAGTPCACLCPEPGTTFPGANRGEPEPTGAGPCAGPGTGPRGSVNATRAGPVELRRAGRRSP